MASDKGLQGSTECDAHVEVQDPPGRAARSFRAQSWLHGALGVVGLAFAIFLIFPKAERLIAGDPSVLGRGAVANLALVVGSLMFLRNARYFRRRVGARSPERAARPDA